MNRYVATGFLTTDPEVRELPSGSTVCNLRLAVKGMAPGYKTGYIDIAVFGKDATNCHTYLHKGSQIGVDGRLEHRTWGEEGNRRQSYTVIGQVTFLDRPPANNDKPADTDTDTDTDPEPAAA